jgi:rubrerythrin
MTLEEALHAALDDEYRARATYRAVLDRWGDVRPFVNIVESEERHIRALEDLCIRHGVSIPPDSWPSRVSLPESLEAACRAAVEAERENGDLYRRLMEAAGGRLDVEAVFRRLRDASQRNHLPAFERALDRERHGGGRGRRGGDGGRGRRHRHRGGRGPATHGDDG